MDRSAEYNRGRQAGYQAGLKARNLTQRQSVREQRFDLFMAAAITGLVQTPWSTPDKNGKLTADTTAEQHANTAAHIARAMLEKYP